MTDIQDVTGYVIGQEDVAWHKFEAGGQKDFWLSDIVIDGDYTSVFNAQVCKIGPGGGSLPHSHTYNHAFYIAGGTGSVMIEQHTFGVKPGTTVKVPAGKLHSVTNPGTEDLTFITIYDPPSLDGLP